MAREEVVQPAIFAVQVALAALLQDWGIAPAAVVGHSVGEVAAAHVAGALDLEDAVRTICQRGRVIQRSAGVGKMAAVELSEVDARALLAPYGPRRCRWRRLTARGRSSSRARPGPGRGICAMVEGRGLFGRLLDLDHAFHSAQLDPCLGELECRPRRGSGQRSVRVYRCFPP